MSVLELFEGQLSYDEIRNMPVPELHSLIDAKDRLIKARIKAREEEALREASKNKQAGLYPTHKN